ncbi:tetratricopeptide repeat protein [Leptospira sp. 2 VSF19]|uniref:Tetratricopeptide repeat protein n=1 Tax=Leptospira soteropolitanensis TaxID=2950025 RepID=A0AAW5VJI4_9LEPT|nr:tetratricopeptide repeat protein [Leptospira soteropolitanensis]MCW7493716.1 tetratricopeptide repeat protein [Leptospira soteropolitanensis]MCW7501314.1 tetratricopeptide repeat protein [Leptospira soteropolitanensis]MCW7523500.1 tetratricopeptide repeat protein [Leptospira soteropolitanensis]MCW7527428.1 tetratricopeptide repeat protein [Leptospira soteropolitanensis]MCW7531284.1 tetratricopeptide repeat protein [Leptospira soteropolitanensis]
MVHRNSLIFLLTFASLLVVNCGRKERSLFEEGKKWEMVGEKTKALYYYELSLRENPDYDPVLKRMGLLLAESNQSIATAIFYLEKYHKQKKDDTEVQRELFRLYLTTGYEKEALEILEEIRFQGKKETLEFFETTYLCLTRGFKQKEYLLALEKSPLAGDPYYAPWVRACETK